MLDYDSWLAGSRVDFETRVTQSNITVEYRTDKWQGRVW